MPRRPGAYVEVRGRERRGQDELAPRDRWVLASRTRARSRSSGVDEPALGLHYVGARECAEAERERARRMCATGPGCSAARRCWPTMCSRDVGLERLRAELPARVLSQGQARRLALARLLIAPRPMWLLDEPAAALDAPGHALVSELIEAHRGAGRHRSGRGA